MNMPDRLEQIQSCISSTLEFDQSSTGYKKVLSLSILSLVVLNIGASIVQTMPELSPEIQIILAKFQTFSIIVFSFEYILRIWSCTSIPQYSAPVLGRFRYALKPLSVIDLIVILPEFVPLLTGIDLRIMRILRLFRMLRILKIARYSRAIQILRNTIVSKKEELVVAFCLMGVMLLICATIMYLVEGRAQPEGFGSIPSALWWGVCTLTTVGYGDVYPETPIGKICGGLICLTSLGFFALPTAIIASGFSRHFQENKNDAVICPHCGKRIHNSGSDIN